MTLDLLREYIVFAKHLNFSRAAAELSMTQSTLSKHVAALEKELGFLVVERGRELRFTAQGKAFLESAQKVVHLYDDELAALQAQFASNAEPVLLYESLSRWTEFLDSLDDVPFSFAEMKSGESIIEGVTKGRMDVGFGHDLSIDADSQASAEERGIDIVPITAMPMGLLLSRDNELARLETLGRDDLRSRTFAVLDGSFFDENSAFIPALFGRDLDLRFSITPISGSLANVDHLQLGDEILLYDRETLRALCERRQDLTMFETLDGIPIEVPIALYCRRDDPNPNVSRFVERARAFFKKAEPAVKPPLTYSRTSPRC